jgi:hypothetical protein
VASRWNRESCRLMGSASRLRIASMPTPDLVAAVVKGMEWESLESEILQRRRSPWLVA